MNPCPPRASIGLALRFARAAWACCPWWVSRPAPTKRRCVCVLIANTQNGTDLVDAVSTLCHVSGPPVALITKGLQCSAVHVAHDARWRIWRGLQLWRRVVFVLDHRRCTWIESEFDLLGLNRCRHVQCDVCFMVLRHVLTGCERESANGFCCGCHFVTSMKCFTSAPERLDLALIAASTMAFSVSPCIRPLM